MLAYIQRCLEAEREKCKCESITTMFHLCPQSGSAAIQHPKSQIIFHFIPLTCFQFHEAPHWGIYYDVVDVRLNHFFCCWELERSYFILNHCCIFTGSQFFEREAQELQETMAPRSIVKLRTRFQPSESFSQLF